MTACTQPATYGPADCDHAPLPTYTETPVPAPSGAGLAATGIEGTMVLLGGILLLVLGLALLVRRFRGSRS